MSRKTKNDNLRARQIGEEVIDLDPNYVSGYLLLGYSYVAEVVFSWTESPGEPLKKAFDLGQRAIALDDGLEGPHRLLGSVYLAVRQPDKAILEFEKAVAIAPNSADALAGMGWPLNAKGRFRESISALERAIRLDPFAKDWFFAHLGFAYFFTGRTNEAVQVFKKAIDLGPSNAENHAGLGMALISVGKADEAVAKFDEALSLNQTSPTWYSGHRAIALVNAGKSDEAVASMKDLLSGRPDDADGYLILSEVLNLLGKHEEALKMAKKGAGVGLRQGLFTSQAFAQALAESLWRARSIRSRDPALQGSGQTVA